MIYDHIIVSAGPSGATLAARLSVEPGTPGCIGFGFERVSCRFPRCT